MYKQFRFKDTDVHIYEQESNQTIKLLQAKNRQPLSEFYSTNVDCLTNASYFTSDYVLGRNQGDLFNDKPNRDNILDLVIDGDNYVLGDFDSWEHTEAKCGLSVATVIIENGKDTERYSTAIVGKYKLNKKDPQTLIGKLANGSWLLIVSDGRSNSNVGLNAYDIREFIRDTYPTIELLCQLDGGGSTQMIVKGNTVNNPSDGIQRPLFNALAFVSDKDNVNTLENFNVGYTALFAHLSVLPNLKVGDIVKYGDYLGKMGNTGHSNGAHLHLGVVKGKVNEPWWLYEATTASDSKYIPNKRELEFFASGKDLFKNKDTWYKARVTTDWGGYKNHYALDLVDDNKIYDSQPSIHWNRSFNGIVVDIGDYGNKRYGKYVLVYYGNDVKEEPKAEPKAEPNTEPKIDNNKVLELEKKLQDYEAKIQELTNANNYLVLKVERCKEQIKTLIEVLGG